MKKSIFFVYSSFILTKTLLGLTFYPYKSVRDTLKRPILLPVLFSPLITMLLLFITAKTGSILIETYGIQREAVAIFLSATLISILFWQFLLLYLFGSFLIINRKSK